MSELSELSLKVEDLIKKTHELQVQISDLKYYTTKEIMDLWLHIKNIQEPLSWAY